MQPLRSPTSSGTETHRHVAHCPPKRARFTTMAFNTYIIQFIKEGFFFLRFPVSVTGEFLIRGLWKCPVVCISSIFQVRVKWGWAMEKKFSPSLAGRITRRNSTPNITEHGIKWETNKCWISCWFLPPKSLPSSLVWLYLLLWRGSRWMLSKLISRFPPQDVWDPFKGKLVEESVQVSGRLACQRGEIKPLISDPSHLPLLMGWRPLGFTEVLAKVKGLSWGEGRLNHKGAGTIKVSWQNPPKACPIPT